MEHTRRTFLKIAGAAGIAVAAGKTLVSAAEQPKHAMSHGTSKELPKQMTFCTLRSDGAYSLGIRTPKGVLDVVRASKILGKSVPTTIDEVIHGADPRALKELVDAALASDGLRSAFIEEAKAPFGPAVTNPEKIICLGYNYKRHVAEMHIATPTSPVLFNKFNNALNSPQRRHQPADESGKKVRLRG